MPGWPLGARWSGVGVGLWRRRRAQATFERTGQDRNRWAVPLLAVLGLALVGWAAGGAPTTWSLPEQLAFKVDGGISATPEFMALLVGLVIYTAPSSPRSCAAASSRCATARPRRPARWACRSGQQMRLVVLPQALRVIIPPLTNQYLNLTKNSSLAVAIGYPDVVSIANTTLNQTGRAVECIAIIMAGLPDAPRSAPRR